MTVKSAQIKQRQRIQNQPLLMLVPLVLRQPAIWCSRRTLRSPTRVYTGLVPAGDGGPPFPAFGLLHPQAKGNRAKEPLNVRSNQFLTPLSGVWSCCWKPCFNIKSIYLIELGLTKTKKPNLACPLRESQVLQLSKLNCVSTMPCELQRSACVSCSCSIFWTR